MIGGGWESSDVRHPAGSFRTLIGRIRLNLILSSSLSLKAYAQYGSETEKLSLDVRLCWLHGKDDELYLVFNNLSAGEFPRFRTETRTAALFLSSMRKSSANEFIDDFQIVPDIPKILF